MTDQIAVEDGSQIRVVRLRRPEKKNALTLEMYAGLADALTSAGRTDSIRAIVVSGGPDVFCAGNDIQDFTVARKAGALGQPVLDFLSALVRCEKPLVASVSNLAVGVAVTMLFHFDYVVANESARFVTPFTSLGIIPEAASGVIAPRVMGNARAFAMLVLGHPLNAVEAKEAGLVNKVVPDAEAAAMQIAQEIAGLPPQAVLTNRRLLKGNAEELVARLTYEDEILKTRLKSAEAGAAFDRFLARKR